MEKIKENFWAQVLIIYTRFLIGGAFVFASVIKIKGLRFTNESGEDALINSPHHFFETMYQTGLYWQFIGMGQCLAGALLMTQIFARLGAVVYFPIILNVFVITISMDFAGTPVITGLMLLANSMLLVWDWDQLKVLCNLPAKTPTVKTLEHDAVWAWAGLAMFAFTFIYRLLYDRYDIVLWFGVCVLIGLIGFIVGWRRRGKYIS